LKEWEVYYKDVLVGESGDKRPSGNIDIDKKTILR
jgi:hypothetical protein